MRTKTPSKGGSLTFPSDPLAAMQELSALDAAPAPEITPAEAIDESVTSYDNMTNKLSDKQEDQKLIKSVRKKSDLRVSQSEGQIESQSIAESIRQRQMKSVQQEVLKTVTLKLSPALDERIERYCFENKMKKQEFWAEAAALFFETIEGV